METNNTIRWRKKWNINIENIHRVLNFKRNFQILVNALFKVRKFFKLHLHTSPKNCFIISINWLYRESKLNNFTCTVDSDPDPYCEVACEGNKVETSVCKSTKNPAWDERITFYQKKDGDIKIEVTIFFLKEYRYFFLSIPVHILNLSMSLQFFIYEFTILSVNLHLLL